MKRLLLIVGLLGLLSGSAWGYNCHTISPSGSGSANGSDWNNTFAGIPATPVRGDVYYLADGTYTSSYTFNLADSGTLTVEIRKATASDFGRISDGCGNNVSAGFNSGTMGSSQAVFNHYRQFTSNTDYFTLNGNGTQGAQGCGAALSAGSVTSSVGADCGIKIDNSACTGSSDACDSPIYSPGNNLTLKYVELIADGNNTAEQYELRGGTNFLLSHVYFHNAGCVFLQYVGSSLTVDHSYFWGTEVNGGSSCHGQFSYDNGSTSNNVYSYNIFRDITGTAIFTLANTSTTHNNWKFYGNVFWATTANTSPGTYGHLSDGITACINSGTVCTNFIFNQNVVYNMGGLNGFGESGGNGGGSYTYANNIWYQNAQSASNGGGTSGSTFTGSFNSWLNNASCTSNTGDVCVGTYASPSAPNPFVAAGSNNFNLASDNGDWNNRSSLGSPYNVDAAGNTFTTDRGAYQFLSNTVANPTFSPVQGTYTANQTITISDSTGGATICYTTDGSTPTTNGGGTCTHGTTYSGTISVTVNTTIKAIGTLSGDTDSSVVTAAYTLQGGPPTCSPGAGSYTSTQTVTLTSPQSQSMCFTTNGTTPASNGSGACSTGTLYSGTITVSASETIEAIGMASGWTDSAVMSCAYTIGPLPTPNSTMSGGAILSGGAIIK